MSRGVGVREQEIMDVPLTDLEATVGTFQFSSYDGEQQDRKGNRAANRCAPRYLLNDLVANMGINQLRSYDDEQQDREG